MDAVSFAAVVAIGVAAPYMTTAIYGALGGPIATLITTAGTSTIYLSTGTLIAAGAISGAIVGGVTAGIMSGGDLDAMGRGALTGAIGGALFAGAGQVGGPLGDQSVERYLAHMGAGCASAMAGGGKCGPGAVAAFAGKWMTNHTGGLGKYEKGVAATIAGGTVSVIGGGKFSNGAVTAAMGYIFNYLSQGRDATAAEELAVVKDAETWKGVKYLWGGMTRDGADCSGSTMCIYVEAGLPYGNGVHIDSASFRKLAAQDGFPFRLLGGVEVRQPGDVILFPNHMAIYAGQVNGQDMMWTARGVGRPYTMMPMKYWDSKPVGWYRYQFEQ